MTESAAPEPETPAGGELPKARRLDRVLLNFGILGRLLIAGWAVATVGVFELDAPEALRVPVALGFFLFVPGAAVMSCARKVDRVTLLALTIGLSLSIDTTAVIVAIYAGVYSPGSLLWVVSILSILLVVIRPLFDPSTRGYVAAARPATDEASRVVPVDETNTEGEEQPK